MHRKPIKNFVLASSFRYRAELLRRIVPHFSTASPDIDESARAGEQPQALAERLASSKAELIAEQFSDALVLGCDQVAYIEIDDACHTLGKPLSHQRAQQQLALCSGRTVHLITACTMIDAAAERKIHYYEHSSIEFKTLDTATIERYLLREQPYDCAGSLKAEGLGIALLNKQRGDDPNALIGLPLIKTVRALNSLGYDVI